MQIEKNGSPALRRSIRSAIEQFTHGLELLLVMPLVKHALTARAATGQRALAVLVEPPYRCGHTHGIMRIAGFAELAKRREPVFTLRDQERQACRQIVECL